MRETQFCWFKVLQERLKEPWRQTTSSPYCVNKHAALMKIPIQTLKAPISNQPLSGLRHHDRGRARARLKADVRIQLPELPVDLLIEGDDRQGAVRQRVQRAERGFDRIEGRGVLGVDLEAYTDLVEAATNLPKPASARTHRSSFSWSS